MYGLHQDCCYKRSLKQSIDASSHEEMFTDTQGSEKHNKIIAMGESSIIFNLKIRTK